MIDKSEYNCILQDIEEILQNSSKYKEEDIKSIQLMKDDIINDIQKELMESRRKKINKVRNIPEPIVPMTEERQRKRDKINQLKKEGRL